MAPSNPSVAEMRDAVETLHVMSARQPDGEWLRRFFQEALTKNSVEALLTALNYWQSLPQQLRHRVLGQTDRRRHERFRLSASVQIKGAEEIPMLTVVDISVSGAFLLSGGTDLSIFVPESRHGVALLDLVDSSHRAEATARIVRHEERGMAIDWSADSGATLSVRRFLVRMGVCVDQLLREDLRGPTGGAAT